MQRACKEYLEKDLQMTPQQIDHWWRYGGGRDARTQLALSDALAHKMAKQRASPQALASHRAPVPPVQRPGVSRPRGADNEAEIARLQSQLETAKGDKAVRLATRLYKLTSSGAF